MASTQTSATPAPASESLERGQLGLFGVIMPGLAQVAPAFNLFFTTGVMVALAAKSKAQVDSVYKKAIELGGKDEGAPGNRGDGFYAGYFRDLDGNKLNAFFMG